MAWAALHLSSKGIVSFVPPVHASLCLQLLQHCSESSKSPKSCSTAQKSMTHDLIIFREHICLVIIVNSLVSTFGDGRPVILCLWCWPVNYGNCRLKGTGQWKRLCCQNFMWTAHTLVYSNMLLLRTPNGRERTKGQGYKLHKLGHKLYILSINVAFGQKCLRMKQEFKWSLWSISAPGCE